MATPNLMLLDNPLWPGALMLLSLCSLQCVGGSNAGMPMLGTPGGSGPAAGAGGMTATASGGKAGALSAAGGAPSAAQGGVSGAASGGSPSASAGESASGAVGGAPNESPSTPPRDAGSYTAIMVDSSYAPAPEVAVNPNVPHGALHDFSMNSADSAIFPTDFATHMPFSRNVSVYVPSQYVAGVAAPFIVVQDGIGLYRDTMVPVLDNMIAARRLPVMIAIFVEAGPNEATPTGERSFEYDSVSDSYAKFVQNELLPKVSKDYNLKLTADPDGRAAMGGSSGGAAAFTMGWFHPEWFHRIVTFSGSFTDLQPNAAYPEGAWSYANGLLDATPAKPLRVTLEVGSMDLNWNTATDLHREWVTANEAMAGALEANGYEYRFVFAQGAGHVDLGVLLKILPDTLAWAWQGYPIP